MATIVIKSILGNTLYEVEAESMREAVEKAVSSAANLSAANLYAANLSAANLYAANLYAADLHDANLRGADLRGANLRGANLHDANLHDANLHDANLHDADLRGARGIKQWYQTIRDDIRSVLDLAIPEVPALRKILVEGRVNGSVYSGECACLVGTIANVRGVYVDNLGDLRPNPGRPAERWFLGIREGDTPTTNPNAAFALVVIDEWLRERESER